MALRELLLPWDAQPQELVAAADGGLSLGLVALINPAAPSPSLDRVGNPQAAILSTDVGIAHAGGSSSMWTQRIAPLGSAASIMYVGNLAPTTGTGISVAFGTSTGGNQMFGFQCGDSTVPGRALLRPSNGVSATTRQFTGLSANGSGFLNHEVIVATYDGTADGLRVYRNGVDQSDALSAFTVGAFADVDNFSLGGVNRGTDVFAQADQHAALAAGWNRVLTDNEINSLAGNPWQLFEPRRIFVPVSAGATTYTLSAPTYVPGSITSTGLTARVTVTAA